MPDATPNPPKRSRKKSGAKGTPPELVGVMAPDAEPEALPGATLEGEGADPATTDVSASSAATDAAGTGETGEAVEAGAEADVPRDGDAAATAPNRAELPDSVLRIERGGIGEATAGTVEVHVGGIGALDASDVFVEWGGIGAARADKLSVEFGSVGASLAGEMRLTQGFAGAVAARQATIEQGLVRTLIAQHVTINRPTGVLVMIAQRVSGDVRPVLDWRGALVAGVGFALVTALLRAFGRRD